MPLGLSPRETTIAEDQFRNAPSAVVPQATDSEIALENIEAVPHALLGGVAQTYAGYRSLATNFGAMGGYDPETSSVVEQEPEAVQRQFAKDSTAIATQYAPDPRKSGAGAKWIYDIGSGAAKLVGDTLVTGNPFTGAAMFGATEGINTRNEIYAATGDKETADKLAIGSALFSGVAALLPGGYGETFAARIASGAVANTTFGVLQRDMMHTGLQDAGYTDMAKQYVPLDGAAMMADGILGTIFGGVHHMFAPEITDSARAIKDAEHAERSSPGIPSDPVSRQNGLDNLDRTISSMIHGDDPPPVGDVNFVPDPKQDAAREAAAKEVQSAKDEAIGKQEEAPEPLPAQPKTPNVGDTIEWKSPFGQYTFRGEVTRLQKDPVTGDMIPIVKIGGKEAPVAEWNETGRVISSKLSRTARAAEAEKEQASKLDPETQEAVLQAHAAIKDNPDLQVADENGKPVSAVEELNKSLDTLKQDDGELAKVALACAGRA